MNRKDYDEAVTEKLENGNFRGLRANSIPVSIKRIGKTHKECSNVIDNSAILRITKVHKPGHEIREIIAATNSST